METIEVEVAYAIPEKQCIVTVTLPAGSTIAEAIERSGIRRLFPEMEVGDVGVFSKRRKLEDVLQHGDRVEIYRPLIADPKSVRRKKARQQDGDSD